MQIPFIVVLLIQVLVTVFDRVQKGELPVPCVKIFESVLRQYALMKNRNAYLFAFAG